MPLDLPRATFQPEAAQCVPTTYQPLSGLRRGLCIIQRVPFWGGHSGAAGLFASLDDLIIFTHIYSDFEPPSLAEHTQDLTRDWTVHHLGRSLGWDLKHEIRAAYGFITLAMPELFGSFNRKVNWH